jgi:hypothetical protein
MNMNVGMKVYKKVFLMDVSSPNYFSLYNLEDYIKSNLKVGVRCVLAYKLVSLNSGVITCEGLEVKYYSSPISSSMFLSIQDSISKGLYHWEEEEDESFKAVVMYFLQPECSNHDLDDDYIDEFIDNVYYDTYF